MLNVLLTLQGTSKLLRLENFWNLYTILTNYWDFLRTPCTPPSRWEEASRGCSVQLRPISALRALMIPCWRQNRLLDKDGRKKDQDVFTSCLYYKKNQLYNQYRMLPSACLVIK